MTQVSIKSRLIAKFFNLATSRVIARILPITSASLSRSWQRLSVYLVSDCASIKKIIFSLYLLIDNIFFVHCKSLMTLHPPFHFNVISFSDFFFLRAITHELSLRPYVIITVIGLQLSILLSRHSREDRRTPLAS